MGKRKDLSDFDKGQIVMARRLGQSISKTAALVGCSRSSVVGTYQKWSKEGKTENRRQGHGRPRLIDEMGERRLALVVLSDRQATVAEIAEKVNACSDRKVSEHTVHRSLLRMGLRWLPQASQGAPVEASQGAPVEASQGAPVEASQGAPVEASQGAPPVPCPLPEVQAPTMGT